MSFTTVSNNIFEIEGILASDILVFTALNKFKNTKTNIAFPSLRKLSETVRLCKQTVINSIERLEEKGVISVERRKKTNSLENAVNKYTVHLTVKPKAKKEDNGSDSSDENLVELVKATKESMKSVYVSTAISKAGGSEKFAREVLVPLSKRTGVNAIKSALKEIYNTNRPITNMKAIILSKFN